MNGYDGTSTDCLASLESLWVVKTGEAVVVEWTPELKSCDTCFTKLAFPRVKGF